MTARAAANAKIRRSKIKAPALAPAGPQLPPPLPIGIGPEQLGRAKLMANNAVKLWTGAVANSYVDEGATLTTPQPPPARPQSANVASAPPGIGGVPLAPPPALAPPANLDGSGPGT